MKAIAYDNYGPLQTLAPRDIDKPAVKDGEVLVRVHAAGLQTGDGFGVRGAPFTAGDSWTTAYDPTIVCAYSLHEGGAE